MKNMYKINNYVMARSLFICMIFSSLFFTSEVEAQRRKSGELVGVSTRKAYGPIGLSLKEKRFLHYEPDWGIKPEGMVKGSYSGAIFFRNKFSKNTYTIPFFTTSDWGFEPDEILGDAETEPLNLMHYTGFLNDWIWADSADLPKSWIPEELEMKKGYYRYARKSGKNTVKGVPFEAAEAFVLWVNRFSRYTIEQNALPVTPEIRLRESQRSNYDPDAGIVLQVTLYLYRQDGSEFD